MTCRYLSYLQSISSRTKSSILFRIKETVEIARVTNAIVRVMNPIRRLVKTFLISVCVRSAFGVSLSMSEIQHRGEQRTEEKQNYIHYLNTFGFGRIFKTKRREVEMLNHKKVWLSAGKYEG